MRSRRRLGLFLSRKAGCNSRLVIGKPFTHGKPVRPMKTLARSLSLSSRFMETPPGSFTN